MYNFHLVLILLSTCSTPRFNWNIECGSLANGTKATTSGAYQSSTKSVISIFDSFKFTEGSDMAMRTIIKKLYLTSNCTF